MVGWQQSATQRCKCACLLERTPDSHSEASVKWHGADFALDRLERWYAKPPRACTSADRYAELQPSSRSHFRRYEPRRRLQHLSQYQRPHKYTGSLKMPARVCWSSIEMYCERVPNLQKEVDRLSGAKPGPYSSFARLGAQHGFMLCITSQGALGRKKSLPGTQKCRLQWVELPRS